MKNRTHIVYPIDRLPRKMKKQGWSIDIVLIFPSGRKRRGYFDPRASVTGFKFFYYRKNSIEDCADLKEFPTHWQYL